MQRITKQQTDRLRHIAQTWRSSEADLVWTMCGSEFAVSRIKNYLWHTTQDGRLIGAAAKTDAPSDDGIWHFIAGDWLTDEEIESLGTSHEEEIQIIAEGGAA